MFRKFLFALNIRTKNWTLFRGFESGFLASFMNDEPFFRILTTMNFRFFKPCKKTFVLCPNAILGKKRVRKTRNRFSFRTKQGVNFQNCFLHFCLSLLCRSFIYIFFMVVLAATCDRAALLTDYVIAEKVSGLGFLLLAAVYISSASSCLATLYGTPRVLQSIASENVIPAIAKLAEGVSSKSVTRFHPSNYIKYVYKMPTFWRDIFYDF